MRRLIFGCVLAGAMLTVASGCTPRRRATTPAPSGDTIEVVIKAEEPHYPVVPPRPLPEQSQNQ